MKSHTETAIQKPFEVGISSSQLTHQDITKPDAGVDIQIRTKGTSGTTIHINVDGVCVLRVCQIPYLEMQIDNGDILHMPHKGKPNVSD
jgi:hypothetical protein